MSEVVLLKHQWIRDLMGFEGPLLSLFENHEGHNFLYYWVGVADNKNRWLVFEVTELELEKYLDSALSLLQLVQNKQNAFIVLIGRTAGVPGEIMMGEQRNVSDLPEDLLPPYDSYYDPLLAEGL